MRRPVTFGPAARAELLDASHAAGVSYRFIEEVDAAVSRIADSPSQFPVVYRDIRRARLPGPLFRATRRLQEARHGQHPPH